MSISEFRVKMQACLSVFSGKPVVSPVILKNEQRIIYNRTEVEIGAVARSKEKKCSCCNKTGCLLMKNCTASEFLNFELEIRINSKAVL